MGLLAVLAFTLIALLPELGRMSRKQIAALPQSSARTRTALARGLWPGRRPRRRPIYLDSAADTASFGTVDLTGCG